MSPFGIAIDAQNRVWVSNSASDTLLRFSASDPSKVETFRAGVSVRGVAWTPRAISGSRATCARISRKPKIPPGVSIMEQFKILPGT